MSLKIKDLPLFLSLKTNKLQLLSLIFLHVSIQNILICLKKHFLRDQKPVFCCKKEVNFAKIFIKISHISQSGTHVGTKYILKSYLQACSLKSLSSRDKYPYNQATSIHVDIILITVQLEIFAFDLISLTIQKVKLNHQKIFILH